jgi:hypothetical protein
MSAVPSPVEANGTPWGRQSSLEQATPDSAADTPDELAAAGTGELEAQLEGTGEAAGDAGMPKTGSSAAAAVAAGTDTRSGTCAGWCAQ